MITISLCMIVKNEEKVIGRCLDSIKDLVDEIIIVDTGSTDSTKEILKDYTDKVYDFKWVDNFSVARNYSFSKATKDYILWIDADDVLLEEDQIKLKTLKSSLDPTVDLVMMKYNAAFDEAGSVTLSYFRERLSKRSKRFRWHEPVHEYLETSGNIINADITITHKQNQLSSLSTGRNLEIYEKSISKGIDFSPRGLYYYARELYHNEKYDKAIIYFNQFLNTNMGWVEDNISACNDLALCYKFNNDYLNMMKTLLRTFEYDTPRAEACCKLGDFYFENRDYKRAVVWYKLATKLDKPIDGWGFVFHDYWCYIPNIQLSLCYYELGYLQEAIYHNDLAGEVKPEDYAVTHNRKFFNSIRK